MRVVVLTTSYPRTPDDVAGGFVRDAVERLRAAGVEVEVVSPATFEHHGIAYGHGVMGNLRERPLKLLWLPALLWNFRRAAAAAVGVADLVHAHWLPAGAIAMTLGKPFVVQLWGTDVEMARRVPWLARHVLRRASLVICPSTALADGARRLGATAVRVIPSGVDLPPEIGAEADPPEVLFAGRLSAEKGILQLVEATVGMNLVVAGDGPLRADVPMALGMIPNRDLQLLYARAALVVCPSLREGFGVACAEAMAHARPVVASAVGGLRDLVVDGETGILVPPGDVTALRAAIERLLADPGARRRMGLAGRARIAERFSWVTVTADTVDAYETAVAGAVGAAGERRA